MDLLRWERQVYNALDYRPDVEKWLEIREKILEQLVHKAPKVKLKRSLPSKNVTRRRESSLSDTKICTSKLIKNSEAQLKTITKRRQSCNNLVRILNLETNDKILTKKVGNNKYNVKVDLDRNSVRVTLFDHIINKFSNSNINDRTVNIDDEVENRILNDEFENSIPSTSSNNQSQFMFKKPFESGPKKRKRSSSTNQKSDSNITSKRAKSKKLLQEKSEIAQYVELFSNDCSENINSPSVSRTTPQIEWKDEWNSDTATTSNINVPTQQEDLNMTLEEFMNFVDGTLIDIDSNEIACVLNESTVSGRESQTILNDNEKHRVVENLSVSNLAFSYEEQPLDLSKKATSSQKESDVNIDLVDVTALRVIEQSPNNDDDSDVSTVNSIIPSSNDSGIDFTTDFGFKAGLSMPLLEFKNGAEWLENCAQLSKVDIGTEKDAKQSAEQDHHEKVFMVKSSMDKFEKENISANIPANDDDSGVSAENSIIALLQGDDNVQIEQTKPKQTEIFTTTQAQMGNFEEENISANIPANDDDSGVSAENSIIALLQGDDNVQIEQTKPKQTEIFTTTQAQINNIKENEQNEQKNSVNRHNSLICSLSSQDTGCIENYGGPSSYGNGAEKNDSNYVNRNIQKEDFLVKSSTNNVEKENISVTLRRSEEESSKNMSANNDDSDELAKDPIIASGSDCGIDETAEIGLKTCVAFPLLEGGDNVQIGQTNTKQTENFTETHAQHTNTEKEIMLNSVLKELTLLEIEGELNNTILDCDEIDDDLISLMASSLGSPTADRLDDFNLSKEMNNGENESTQKCEIINNELVDNAVTSFKFNSRNNTSKASTETTISCSIPEGLEKISSKSNEPTLLNEIRKEKLNCIVKTFNVNPKNNGISEITPNSRMSQRFQQSFLPNYQIPKKIPQLMEMELPQLFPSVDVRNNNEEKQNIIDQNSILPYVNRQITNTTNIDGILPIFGATCCSYTRNICTEKFCRYSHQLNNACITRNRLEAFSFHSLNIIYKYVRRSSLLFRTYFEIFCDIFTNRNCRLKLLNMVYDCQLHSDYCLFLKIIYQHLIKCGLIKINACRQLIKRTNKDTSLATANVLTDIIIDADATKFCDILHNFISIPYYKLQMSSLNALALKAIQENHIELASVIFKCLINVDTHEFMTMKSPELIQLLEMIKNSSF